MESIKDAPPTALQALATTGAEAWVVSRPGSLGLLMARFDVPPSGGPDAFSVTVTGWTHEELAQRIEGLRLAARSLLRRRRREGVAAGEAS